MAYWEDFDKPFSFKRDFTYDTQVADRIILTRKTLGGTLFVDRLFKILGIESPSKVYPPRTNANLRALYSQIIASSSPNTHKQSLIYYILRDCRGTSDGSKHLQFARRSYLPEQYRLLIDGLWHLDRLEFRRALEFIMDPSLIPLFPDEILYVLATSPKRDDNLAIAYYVTVNPPLASSKYLNAYFGVVCRKGIVEAFNFTRKQQKSTSLQLLEQLITFVLSTNLGETRANRALALVNLPFNDVEEGHFEDVLLRGSAKNLLGAKDTVMMRRIATSRLENLDAELEALSGRKIEGFNWDDLRRNLRANNSLAS
ncbi:hypothetical protein FQN57_002205 [Myotisia sp. PD_48]|nr:hypothetical protein FQN57_002205 [Myotisia sp. PD_48]